MKRSEVLYQKGYEIVENHINIFKFVNSVRKMEAGLSALIEENPELIRRTKDIYYTNQIVFSDSEEEKEMKKHNAFYDFLHQNDREIISKK